MLLYSAVILASYVTECFCAVFFFMCCMKQRHERLSLVSTQWLCITESSNIQSGRKTPTKGSYSSPYASYNV